MLTLSTDIPRLCALSTDVRDILPGLRDDYSVVAYFRVA